MSEKIFKIEELRGPVSSRRVFQWTTSAVPRGGQVQPDVGYMAAPRGSWEIGGKLRHVKTEYPGATEQSFQILGLSLTDQEFAGVLDDRYNATGFGQQTARDFEEMMRRGSDVRISYEQDSFVGIIDTYKFTKKNEWQTTYSFVFVPAKRSEWTEHKPATTPNGSIAEKARLVGEATAKLRDDTASAPRLVPAPGSENGESLGQMADRMLAEVYAATDTLTQAVSRSSINNANNPFVVLGRIGSAAGTVRGQCLSLAAELAAVKAESVTSTKSALAVLDFEIWVRTMRTSAYLLAGKSLDAAETAEERRDPSAKRLYRPYAGESLYAISNREYGTPYAWRLIADRNGLRTLTLKGDELLVIPERGES